MSAGLPFARLEKDLGKDECSSEGKWLKKPEKVDYLGWWFDMMRDVGFNIFRTYFVLTEISEAMLDMLMYLLAYMYDSLYIPT